MDAGPGSVGRMNRLAAVPSPVPEPAAASIPSYNLTIADLCGRLAVTRVKILDDVMAGLPCLDLGRPRPRPAGLPAPRRKRALRFCWAEVIAWYRERGRA